MQTGIDVSEHQGAINWPKVAAAGASFAICRATYGTKQDMTAETNVNGARDAGMVVGLYHFLRFNSQSAQGQADAFLTVALPLLQAVPGIVALDLEGNTVNGDRDVNVQTRAEYVALASEWLRIVEHDMKRQAVIYTGPSFWTDQVGGADLLPRKLWIANYTAKPQPKVPKPWTDWTIWQHAADASTGFQGTIDGVTGDCDLNWFNGDEAALQALAGGSDPGVTTGKPERPELQANLIAALQRAFNPFAASFGVAQLAVDGILGPLTRAAMKLAGL